MKNTLLDILSCSAGKDVVFSQTGNLSVLLSFGKQKQRSKTALAIPALLPESAVKMVGPTEF